MPTPYKGTLSLWMRPQATTESNPNSPALSFGFVNFNMDDFGVHKPEAQRNCPATGDGLEVKQYHANSQRNSKSRGCGLGSAKVRNIVGLR